MSKPKRIYQIAIELNISHSDIIDFLEGIGESGYGHMSEVSSGVYSKIISKSYIRKFAWRDLSYWFLWRFPNVCDVSFRPAYENQSWTSNSTQLKRWQRGQTGYPLVDAAMRQLWLTGWQPNYLRHIVAGFLIEYCNIDWKHGILQMPNPIINESRVSIIIWGWVKMNESK